MKLTKKSDHYRWIVLAVYSAAAGMSQLLWLNFAPLLDQIQKRYGVGETASGMLLMVFPLVYVFLAIPAGVYIDRKGYRRGIGVGVILMTVFAALRIIDAGFWFLLLAQTGIAVAQPFVINGISKLVMDWFDKKNGAVATGLGTMGMFIGMAVGMAATPPLVAARGFQGAMIVFALVTLAIALAFFVFVHPRENATDKTGAHPVKDVGSQEYGFKELLGDKNLTLLFILSFLGLGFFNGLTTWLELILAPNGINSIQAGVIGGVLILGGIGGAVVIPAFSDFLSRRKPFLIGSIGVALATVFPLCHGRNFDLLLFYSALQGFFFLPAFSLLLEMCSELVGESRAASATGILMLTGNGGGVIVILAMEWIKGDAPTFARGVDLLAAILICAIFLSLFLAETHPGKSVASRLARSK